MASVQAKKSKAGKKTYYVVVSLRGKHKWLKAGNLKDAKTLKKQIESMEESRRIEKLGITGKDKRVDDFFQKYAEYVRLRTAPNTLKRYRSVLNTFIVFLRMFHSNVRSLSQIKPELIESYQKHRLESIELKTEADGDKPGVHSNKRLPLPQTVNYEVSVLRSAFMWAHERELMAAVPTRRVKRLRTKPKKRPKILTRQECQLFLRTARQLAKTNKRLRIFARAFTFLLNTGLRSGELCNLTWEDVDLDSGLIQIRAKEGWTPKSYSREFYLNRAALKVLRSPGDSQDYVFTDIDGHQLESDNLRKALIKTAKAAILDDFTRVHDLRHTFSSLMQMQGIDRGTVATILGHKDLSTTLIYTHQTQEHLKKCHRSG